MAPRCCRSTPYGDEVAGHLFDRDHLVIALVDGMGMGALDEPAYADLRGRVRMELDSVFPATTACAITTVATASGPDATVSRDGTAICRNGICP